MSRAPRTLLAACTSEDMGIFEDADVVEIDFSDRKKSWPGFLAYSGRLDLSSKGNIVGGAKIHGAWYELYDHFVCGHCLIIRNFPICTMTFGESTKEGLRAVNELFVLLRLISEVRHLWALFNKRFAIILCPSKPLPLTTWSGPRVWASLRPARLPRYCDVRPPLVVYVGFEDILKILDSGELAKRDVGPGIVRWQYEKTASKLKTASKSWCDFEHCVQENIESARSEAGKDALCLVLRSWDKRQVTRLRLEGLQKGDESTSTMTILKQDESKAMHVRCGKDCRIGTECVTGRIRCVVGSESVDDGRTVSWARRLKSMINNTEARCVVWTDKHEVDRCTLASASLIIVSCHGTRKESIPKERNGHVFHSLSRFMPHNAMVVMQQESFIRSLDTMKKYPNAWRLFQNYNREGKCERDNTMEKLSSVAAFRQRASREWSMHVRNVDRSNAASVDLAHARQKMTSISFAVNGDAASKFASDRMVRETIVPSPTREATKEQGVVRESGRAFVIHDLLSADECAFLKKRVAEIGFESIEWEYHRSYRHCERVLTKSPSLATELWRRIRTRLQIEDVRGMRPYGFGQSGTWRPYGVNECVRFCKYGKGGHFQPHRDGGFVLTDDDRSVYTVLIYLNSRDQDFRGGSTVLFPGNDESDSTVRRSGKEDDSSVQVDAKQGTALLFNHDMMHAGGIVESGEKIILRTDIMCRRVYACGPAAAKAYRDDARYNKAEELYAESIRLQGEGKPEASTRAYLAAMEIQATLPSLDPSVQISMDAMRRDVLWGKQRSMPMWILSYLTPQEVGLTCARVSVGWWEASQSQSVWCFYVSGHFPEVFRAHEVSGTSPGVLTDWKLLFRRHLHALKWEVMCVDIGRFSTKVLKVGLDEKSAVRGASPGRNRWNQRQWIASRCGCSTVLRMPSLIANARGHYWGAGSGLKNCYFGFDALNPRMMHMRTIGGSVRGYHPRGPYPDVSDNVDVEVMDVILGTLAHNLDLRNWRMYCKTNPGYYGSEQTIAQNPLVLAEPMQGFSDAAKRLLVERLRVLQSPLYAMPPASLLVLLNIGTDTGLVVSIGAIKGMVIPVVDGVPLRMSVTQFKTPTGPDTSSYKRSKDDPADVTSSTCQYFESTYTRFPIGSAVMIAGGTEATLNRIGRVASVDALEDTCTVKLDGGDEIVSVKRKNLLSVFYPPETVKEIARAVISSVSRCPPATRDRLRKCVLLSGVQSVCLDTTLYPALRAADKANKWNVVTPQSRASPVVRAKWRMHDVVRGAKIFGSIEKYRSTFFRIPQCEKWRNKKKP